MKDLEELVKSYEQEMVETLSKLVSIKAVNVRSGEGQSEWDRVKFLEPILKEMGLDTKVVVAPDPLVPEGRPNLLAVLPGKDTSRTLWFIGHLDTVPAGDPSLWSHDPFEAHVEDGKIYGRGAEDNGQAVITSLFAVKALIEAGIKPNVNIGLAFVADEETGSDYGIIYLIQQGIFKPTDMAVVPDSGDSEGSFIEVAEKSMMWLKFKIMGKQTHASMPGSGINAHKIGMMFALSVDEALHDNFSDRDELFEPPFSTFEITKKEANVENINTIPGSDVFYMDMRILPDENLDDILRIIDEIRTYFEYEYKVRIQLEIIQRSDAPAPTDPEHPLVKTLASVIKETRGIEPKVGGIGGGTCAAPLRRVGIPSVVWATIDELAHQPDEYAKIENLTKDALVFAKLMSRME
ncbi:MAG TPA: M20 family metallo-hydrolase [Coprothermobacter proteolyticus]|nr:M20 family metallo-hydrolase [Coprothermobacter proteolyticus]